MDSEDIVSEDDQVNSDNQDNAYSAEESDDMYNMSDGEGTYTSEDSDFLDKELLNNLKKMVMKSMKRKKRRKVKTNGKRKQRVKCDSKHTETKADDCGSTASSRYNVTYFFDIIKSLSVHHRDLISGIGFGSLLEFDGSATLRSFTQWIADNVNVTTEDICLDNKSIRITPESVNDVLGIPLNGNEVEIESESAKADFLALFGLTKMPSIKYFGTKILKNVLTDDEFIRCFMVVALSAFLCPTSSTKPSTKYLSALIDTGKIKDFDWCKFVHDWIICYIKKYQNCSRTLGGCPYYLAVRYLDFLDFGTAQLPLTLPRISVWKGEMIKDFCKLDLLKDGKYGKRPIKDISQTCYAPTAVMHNTAARMNEFRNCVELITGQSINQMVIGDICAMFQTYIENKDDNTCSQTQSLLLDVLKCLVDSCSFATATNALISYVSHGKGNTVPTNDYHQSDQQTMNSDSQSTEKVNYSEDNMQNSNNPCNESQSTVKVNSNGSIEKTPSQQVPIKKRKRSSQNHSSSQHSIDSVTSHTRSRSKLRETTGKSPLSQLDNSGAANKELDSNKVSSYGKSASLEHMLSQDGCTNSVQELSQSNAICVTKVDNNETSTQHGDKSSPSKSKVVPNGADIPPHPMFASIHNLGNQNMMET